MKISLLHDSTVQQIAIEKGFTVSDKHSENGTYTNNENEVKFFAQNIRGFADGTVDVYYTVQSTPIDMAEFNKLTSVKKVKITA